MLIQHLPTPVPSSKKYGYLIWPLFFFFFFFLFKRTLTLMSIPQNAFVKLSCSLPPPTPSGIPMLCLRSHPHGNHLLLETVQVADLGVIAGPSPAHVRGMKYRGRTLLSKQELVYPFH